MVLDASARVPSVILWVLRCFEVYSHSEAVLSVEHWLPLDIDSLAGAQDSCLDVAVWCVAVVVLVSHQEVAIHFKTEFGRKVGESESGVSVEALEASHQMGLVVLSERIKLGGVEVSAVSDEATELTRLAHAVVQSARPSVAGHLGSGRWSSCWRVCVCVVEVGAVFEEPVADETFHLFALANQQGRRFEVSHRSFTCSKQSVLAKLCLSPVNEH